jgi:hypothetical protein
MAVLLFAGVLALEWSDRGYTADQPGFDTFSACIEQEVKAAQQGSINPGGAKAIIAAASAPEVSTLLDSEIPAVERTKTATSGGVGLTDARAIGAIVVVPVPNSDWGRALALNPEEGAPAISQHYLAQLSSLRTQNPQLAKAFMWIVAVYAAPLGNGRIDCALSLTDVEHRQIVYSAEKLGQLPKDRSNIRLEELPSQRSDVTADLVLVEPGTGYLISPSDVLESEQYRAYLDTLDPSTRATMIQSIQTDTTQWLVDEAHISWFDVDKDAAHRKAMKMWNDILQQAQARLGP